MTIEQRATDTSLLLRLGTVGPYLLLSVFVSTNGLLVFSNLPADPIPDIVAFALVAGAAVRLALPANPLPLTWTVVTATVPVLASILVSSTLPHTLSLGYLNWYLGASSFLMFFLALRNRILWAWCGLLAMCVATVTWVLLLGFGILDGINLVVRHAGILLIGTFFAVAFSRASSRIETLQAVQSHRSALESAAEAAIDIRVSKTAELDGIARGMLTKIAAGEQLSMQDRADCLLMEANLRDSVRAQALHREPVIGEARAARARGVEVTLLDDSGIGLSAGLQDVQELTRLAGIVADELRGTRRGRLTARVLPIDREILATVIIDSGDETRSIEIPRSSNLSRSNI
jgi:hypothetical protein